MSKKNFGEKENNTIELNKSAIHMSKIQPDQHLGKWDLTFKQIIWSHNDSVSNRMSIKVVYQMELYFNHLLQLIDSEWPTSTDGQKLQCTSLNIAMTWATRELIYS